MGIIYPDEFALAYDSIKRASRDTQACSVVILVAAEVDAICACRILASLFKNDFISHKVIPVRHVLSLQEKLTELGEIEEVRSIITINCGGQLNLSAQLSQSQKMIYVIDSHRPIELGNFFAKQVSVLYNEQEEEELEADLTRLQEAYLGLLVEVDEEMEEEVVEEENLRYWRRLIDRYYEHGDWLGKSCGVVMYEMSKRLDRTDRWTVWYAAIGTSSQLMDHEETEAYKRDVALLRQGLPSAQSEEDTVEFQADDLRLVLFRHWSLYDSMLHSRFMASKLGVWKERGRTQLLHLLAKMGAQAQETHEQMKPQLKKELKKLLKQVAPTYQLGEVSSSTFVRTFGYHGSLSSADAVHSLLALLSSEKELVVSLGLAWDDSIWGEGEEWIAGFWRAYDALGRFDLAMIGVRLSMALHRALLTTASALFERRGIRSLEKFRLAVVQDEMFSHAAALHQLAMFIQEALRAFRKKELPLVVARQRKEKYLVLGLHAAGKSKLGVAFQRSIGGAEPQAVDFNSFVMEVEDLFEFAENLNLYL